MTSAATLSEYANPSNTSERAGTPDLHAMALTQRATLPPVRGKPPRRTHCKHGHALTPDNVIIRKRRKYPNRREISCRKCHYERNRALVSSVQTRT